MLFKIFEMNKDKNNVPDLLDATTMDPNRSLMSFSPVVNAKICISQVFGLLFWNSSATLAITIDTRLLLCGNITLILHAF